MKRVVCVLAVFVALCPAVAFAQAFADVPEDHWAYDAVESLQSRGLIIGYHPDGTFEGKRAMSRYELAIIVRRLLLPPEGFPVTFFLATKDDVEAVRKSIPVPVHRPALFDYDPYLRKDDLARMAKLVDEFKSELQSLGADVDEVKRNLAALTARADAIENEQRRVRITGRMDAIGKANFDNTNPIMVTHQFRDLDFRRDNTAAGFRGGDERDINVLRNFDLDINARINDKTTAMATISIGNYINYLNTGTAPGSNDSFVPYYMSVTSDIGLGDITVGRFPLRLTPYTFLMPDADSYVFLPALDNGNRPVDGAMLKTSLGPTDWTLFAAQHEKVPSYAGFGSMWYGVPFTQSAGARVTYAIPDSITLGGTFYRGWNRHNFKSPAAPDILDVMGADVGFTVPSLNRLGIGGSWTRSTQRLNGTRMKNLDEDAWDVALSTEFDSIVLAGGYRDVGKDFAAPGAWDTVGYVNNPVNVKGFYGSGHLRLSDRLYLFGSGSFYKMTKRGSMGADYPVMAKDDRVNRYYGAIDYSFSKNDTVGLSYEYVRLDVSSRPAAFEAPRFSYLTWQYDRKLGENTFVKLGYQLIEFRSGMRVPMASDPSYFGSVGWAQVGVSF